MKVIKGENSPSGGGGMLFRLTFHELSRVLRESSIHSLSGFTNFAELAAAGTIKNGNHGQHLPE